MFRSTGSGKSQAVEKDQIVDVSDQRIEKAILKQLSNSNNPDDLKSISRVYEEEVKDRKRAGQRYQGYELIQEVFDFKARIQQLARKRAKEMTKRRASGRSTVFLFSKPFLNVNEFRYDWPRGGHLESTLTLATVEKLGALHYVVSIAETIISRRLLILLGRNGNRTPTVPVKKTVTTRAISLSSLIFLESRIDQQHSKSCHS